MSLKFEFCSMNSLIGEKISVYATQLVPEMPMLGHFIQVYDV